MEYGGSCNGLSKSTTSLPKNEVIGCKLQYPCGKAIGNKPACREQSESCNKDPDLTRFAKQGVLLLNASLSVRKGEANSHADYGWHTFTDAIISVISEHAEHVVFMLWGAFAKEKSFLIDETRHLILTSVHPSPLSAHRGFFGNNHFKKANEYLKEHGRGEVNWC